MNIHEQINELIAALKENTAALKGAAVQTDAPASKRARGLKSETPTTETPAAPEKVAETPKVEEKKPVETPKPEPAAEAPKPGVPEFRALAQKLLDAQKIDVVRAIVAKYKLPKGASSAVGTEHEDAVYADLQKAVAALPSS